MISSCRIIIYFLPEKSPIVYRHFSINGFTRVITVVSCSICPDVRSTQSKRHRSSTSYPDNYGVSTHKQLVLYIRYSPMPSLYIPLSGKTTTHIRTSSRRSEYTPNLGIINVEGRLPTLHRPFPPHDGNAGNLVHHGILLGSETRPRLRVIFPEELLAGISRFILSLL